MGSYMPPKQFSAPGVLLSPDQQQSVVAPSRALPQLPTNPNLQLQLDTAPLYSAPNATASPVVGKDNNPNPTSPLNYKYPGTRNTNYVGATRTGLPKAY